MESKYCASCKQYKSKDLFNSNKWNLDGLQFYCRACINGIYFTRVKENLPIRICVWPECSKPFRPRQRNTFWCRQHHKNLAVENGIELKEILTVDSYSKLPEKSFIGAEEQGCEVI